MENPNIELIAPEQKKPSGAKKALNVIKNILVILIVAVAVFMMIFTIVSMTTFDRDERSLFGYRAYIALSDSMSATDFDAGDLVLVKEVDPATLQEGDIISFRSQNTESFGELVTHKIRRCTTTADGEPGFITYGTTTNTDDEGIVTYSFILGKYQSRIPKVGTFFRFLKTTPGYIICILVPFLLLIIFQGGNCVQLFRQYKKEQMADIQAARDQVEAERAENRKIMEQLQQLQQQLSKFDSGSAEPTADSQQQSSIQQEEPGAESSRQ